MNTINEQMKTLSFPKRRSIGSLYSAPINQPEEWELLTRVRGLVVAPENEPIHWELLDEARGLIEVPLGLKLKLKISPDAEDLVALTDLDANDLHAVDFSHSAVTDQSLTYLQHLTGLRFLELTSTTIGDHGLSFVRNLHELHSIGLSYSRVSSQGLKNLKGLTDLREIWLSGTQVDDLSLEHLNNLQQLVQLGLSSTLITDAGLLNLVKLKKLLRVYLFNTKVTHNGTQLLKNLLPNCRVKWHPPKSHTRDTENLVTVEDHGHLTTSADKDMTYAVSKFEEVDFWKLIVSLNWQEEGNDNAVIAPVIKKLAQLEVQDIFKFADILAHKLYLLDGKSYAQEIGIDAYDGNKGGFAKNWFLYVRCCAVANGSQFYSSVLAMPNKIPKDTEFQALLTIAPQAYKIKTGKRFSYVTEYSYETFSNTQLWINS